MVVGSLMHRSLSNAVLASIAALTGFLAFTTVGHAQPADRSNEFLRNAIIAERFEIEVTKLALSKSTNADVQQSAAEISTESQTLLEKLTKVAQSMNAPIPTELDTSRRGWLQDLEKKRGPEFDQAYWARQLEAYNQTRGELRNYEREGANPDIRKIAAEIDNTIIARQQVLRRRLGL